MEKSIIFLSLLLTSCATLINGKTQDIAINSSPAGATVTINDEYLGITPLNVKVNRKYDFDLILSMYGYVPVSKTYSKKLNATILGNFFIGGIPGLIIDFTSGSAYYFDVNNDSNSGIFNHDNYISLQLKKF